MIIIKKATLSYAAEFSILLFNRREKEKKKRSLQTNLLDLEIMPIISYAVIDEMIIMIMMIMSE